MMAWLGLYLAGTDLRLCNAYSLQSQWRAGWGLVGLAAAMGVAWALDMYVGRPLASARAPLDQNPCRPAG
jgi:hypothetical protein